MPDHTALSQRHAFLAAIKDDPENDTSRLVFADWLDDHGEPEARSVHSAAVPRR